MKEVAILSDLATEINTHHEQAQANAKRAIEHALKAGEYLIEAKAAVAHGEWLPWLKEHTEIPERTAQHYMRLANNREQLEAKTATLADLTVTEAVQQIAEPKSLTPIYDNAVRLFNEFILETEQRAAIPIEEIEDLDAELKYWVTIAMNTDIECDLARIRIRARRGIGELLPDMDGSLPSRTCI